MIEIGMRAADGSEDAALAALMFAAIHEGPSLYDAAQRRAWLPQPHGGPGWQDRLAAQDVWVARAGESLQGFVTLKGDYIDLAFVAPQQQGRGLFAMIYPPLEKVARRRGLTRLTTHASRMAQPAFRGQGFSVIAHEEISQAGQTLPRAEMEKLLS
ncbi:MAG: GNAT family N-acetyltransferase [Sulfitobacter sp.]|nr:GNAT family N-acetyltransferase [Sulfitobacter sp.]